MTNAVEIAPTLAPGFLVAILPLTGIKGYPGYVGEVQATSAAGLRITNLDAAIGAFAGWDIFVPWHQIKAVLVCTSDHDARNFLEEALMWIESGAA